MNEITQSQQGQFAIALWIVLHLIWLISWIISVIKYYWNPRRSSNYKKKYSTFSVIFYCRRKAKPWRDSIPEMMDYVMLIFNAIIVIIVATVLLANILFQNPT